MLRIGTRLNISGLAWCLLVLGSSPRCCAAEAGAGETAEALMLRAATAESGRRSAEAIAAYESLLRRDTSFEAVVAPRLVNLYAGGGQAAPALSWAVRVARRMPEPKPYLAGVHARLGQWKESELLLRQALRETRDPGKRQPLLWQLADVQEGQNDGEAALATLTGAREAAPDAELRKTSAQRLDALRRRLAASQAKTEAKP